MCREWQEVPYNHKYRICLEEGRGVEDDAKDQE